ncbi:MAG: ABC transporter permease [Nitrososphaeria archaeon]
MKSKFINLLIKDTRDLMRDPRIYVGLVIPLIVFGALGGLMSAVIPSGPVSASVAVYTQSPNASEISSILQGYGLNVHLNQPAPDAVAVIRFQNASITERSLPLQVYVTFNMSNLDEMQYIRSEYVQYALSQLNTNLTYGLLSARGITDYRLVTSPVNYTVSTQINGRTYSTAPSTLYGVTQLQMLLVPILLASLSLLVAEMSATSIAAENEEKTLEMMLTFPIRRSSILLSKMATSFLIAIVGTAFYLGGMLIYLFAIPEISAGSAAFTLITAPVIIAFIISLIIATVFSAVLGIIVGILSEDVRVANTYIGIITIPVIIPAMVYMLGGSVGTSPLPLKLLMLALPPTYPIAVSKSFITAQIAGYVWPGIALSVIETVLLVLVASRLLVPDKLSRIKNSLKIGRNAKSDNPAS